MRERVRLRRPSHPTVVAYLALFVALCGSAYAVNQLPKKSVGAKQLKKNAVTTAKIRKQAVTAAKIRTGTLTGAQINFSTLGTVPTAQRASTAELAQTLAASEDWHEVGAPGEPGFLKSWVNNGGSGLTAAFYRDREGVVHLKGLVTKGTGVEIFQLPPGYRPAGGKILGPPIACVGGFCSGGVGPGAVYGSGWGEKDGLVSAPPGATLVSLDGITFRAES
jgi:hypothetical protein